MLIGRNREHFFLIFLSTRAKLLTPRTAKILAPDWLRTPFLHFVVVVFFFILCRDNNDIFQLQVGVWLFKPDCLCQKYLEIKCYSYKGIPKGELTRNSKILFVSKAKNVIGFVWLKNWNHSWPRPSAFTSLRLLPTNDNRTIITVPFWWEEGAGLIQWKKLACKFLLWTHGLLFLLICNRVIIKPR